MKMETHDSDVSAWGYIYELGEKIIFHHANLPLFLESFA